MSIETGDDQDMVNFVVQPSEPCFPRKRKTIIKWRSGHCKNNKCSWRLAF